MDIEKNIEKIRDDIYGLDYITFLDTAGQCPIMKNQTEASKEFWEYYTSVGIVTHGDPTITPAKKCQAEAAKIINADEKDIIMIPRPNHAFNLIKDIIPWKKGDNVVFTDLGYPDSGATWLSLREKGVELRQIKNVNGRILPSDMERVVDENTKIVVVNRTTWACGFTFDMDSVCKIAHEKGAYVVDDFFQTSQAVDVTNPQVDFAFAGSWKWLMGPQGATGFLYIRPELQDKFVPTYMTYGVVEVPKDKRISLFTEGFRGPNTYTFAFRNPKHDNVLHYDFPLAKGMRRYQQGLVSSYHLWLWYYPLKYLNDLGVKEIEKRTLMLSGYLIEQLLDLGLKVNTPMDPKERAGLVSYNTGREELNWLILEACRGRIPMRINNIFLSLRYQGGVGGIRVSCHYFNTKDDLDKLIKVTKEIIS